MLATCRDADALIMAAAVADFQAAQLAEHKIKKTKDTVEFDVHLTRTPDILQAVKEQKESIGKPRITIGFAAETQNLIDNALAKLKLKDSIRSSRMRSRPKMRGSPSTRTG